MNLQTKSKPHIVELKIPSVGGYEDFAMELAASFAKYMGFSEKKIGGLKTAVGEACANAIEHGNKFREDTFVVINFIVEEDVRLQVDVQDQGEGGAKFPLEKPDIHKKIQKRANKFGLGMFLIKKLVDECKLSDNEKGMRLSMAIYLHKEEDE